MLDLQIGSTIRAAELGGGVASVSSSNGVLRIEVGVGQATSFSFASETIVPTPAVDASGLTSEGGTLIAAGPDGKELWRQPGVVGKLVGRTTDRIIELGADNQLRGINVNGTLEWNTRLDHALFVSDAQLVDGIVYAFGRSSNPDKAEGASTIAALDATTGSLVWSATLAAARDGLVRVAGDVIVVGFDNETSTPSASTTIVAVDRATGAALWSQPVSHPHVVALEPANDGVLVVTTDQAFGCA